MTNTSTGLAPVLTVRDLSVALPGKHDRPYAVKDVSFDLMPGEILCIIGESGSGKSVTASTVMGLLPEVMSVESGSIMFKGDDLTKLSDGELRKLRGRAVSIIFQDPLSALNPLMTIGDQIREVLNAHNVGTKASRADRVVEMLSEVGLPDPMLIQHQYPFRLSGGQRQRVMIAMALALAPDILIADEPTTALDVTTQAQILSLISEIQKSKGMSVMFITHDFGVVAEIADRVVVMEQGLVVEQGTARQVLDAPEHPYTKKLIAAVPKMREEDRSREQDKTAVLEVRNLNKTYRTRSGFLGRMREVHAVNDISFTLHRGETLGIVGESGSGKSSMGKVLMKLIDADSGQIIFQGKDTLPLDKESFRPLRARIQMIFQDPYASLNPRFTIGQALTVGPVAHDLVTQSEARKLAQDTLELVGLDPSAYDRYPHEFSGGQRQRVGIARALMFNPEVIVADEAVSALDVSIQAQVLALLDKIRHERKLAMVFITHDLRVASQISDEILVMHRGKMVEYGPPSQIFYNPQHDYTRSLVDAIPGGKAA
ncbi:ABC transporter ATP-binding protein [Pseudosulfitobacter pseudonitzschiae]|uniref:ABC transporter ATP-binding protein n=1 Tax=Pseudosulfitobacter pseudonitzschiae TaxID=1402135 RepID=A0A073J150_9RHOB|nr:ABC transporter ATP-binding protein [Pseudosulfitobacter pseudonitzschiae]KEJ95540.1 ABC transporter ATP-binding protein [Pseudosulfitobacter pseudonitzschiae]MBM1816010.1 ABC transporter ATP-binding protein [Pseudosulfitobacter pseudonitzschiae]MBM1833316.1 ABC transporter ATP-binding protein [Pseudosulfitobacter pseudonitzschiae]MBM1838183.1 ABC transporter ATP-binding protein [Pseudosulfitobacter pseudonitzschiae]MBM1842715.1 ABC transporter ATP-binding protein [Pseudosulfitobacter pseud